MSTNSVTNLIVADPENAFPQSAGSPPVTFADRAANVTRYGIPVMPLCPRQKNAFLENWPNRATTNADQVASWNEENPNYNAGAVARNGEFWMFEIDSASVYTQITKETGHALDEIETLVVQSSGVKRHFYFKQNAESSARGNFSVDRDGSELFSVRAHNAYVVAPGSIHPDTGQPYEIKQTPLFGEIPVAPDWLMAWLFPYSQKHRVATTPKQIPEIISEGSRNKTLASVAGSLRRRGASEAVILAALRAMNQQQCQPLLDDAEVEKIAGSVANYEPADNNESVGPIHNFQPQRNTHTNRELEFHRSPVNVEAGTHRDYVIAPTSGETDGWFPKGEVSLIGAPSGASKTTMMYQLLLAQAIKAMFFGHETYGRSFTVLALDRGKNAHLRTMERMRLRLDAIPFARLELKWDVDAVQEIVNQIEEINPLPEIVLIEGVDFMVSEVSSIKSVSAFMVALDKVAKRYHIAVIGSLGSPKVKVGMGYIAKRDNLLGSAAWGRLCETIVNLQFPKSDDTSGRRELYVLLRNGKSEHLSLGFRDGQLEIIPDCDTAGDKDDSVFQEIQWFKEQARLAKDDPTKKWWTILDFQRALNMPHATAQRHVDHEFAKNHIRPKPGKRNGKAKQYCWNESETNPLWVEQQRQETF